MAMSRDSQYRDDNRDIWCIADEAGNIHGTIECEKGKLSGEDVLKDFDHVPVDLHAFLMSASESEIHKQHIRAKRGEHVKAHDFIKRKRKISAERKRGLITKSSREV